MKTLAEEIDRQPGIFDSVSRAGVEPVEPLSRQHISGGRNGFFALSGALIGFGRAGGAGPLSLDWYRDGWAHRAVYSRLTPTDFVFGCDVFADLLFLRDGAVHRLDGETGDCSCLAESVAAFRALPIREAVELLGGNPAREHFGGRFLSADPSRLLPETPIVIKGGEYKKFLTVPLTVALRRKAMLCQKIAELPDGEEIDLTFWHVDIH